MPKGWDFGLLRDQNYILSVRLSVMLSPPKPLDEMQPNLVCELLTCMGRATAIFPRPLGPMGGVKRSNIIKFQLQSQFQRIVIQNFVFVLTNEKYKTYQMGFLFCRLGHALGIGLGGA